jgi:hypothetical protein
MLQQLTTKNLGVQFGLPISFLLLYILYDSVMIVLRYLIHFYKIDRD